MSMMVPDALVNIESRSGSQKISRIENLGVESVAETVFTRPNSLILGLSAPNFAHR